MTFDHWLSLMISQLSIISTERRVEQCTTEDQALTMFVQLNQNTSSYPIILKCEYKHKFLHWLHGQGMSKSRCSLQ